MSAKSENVVCVVFKRRHTRFKGVLSDVKIRGVFVCLYTLRRLKTTVEVL